MSFYSPQTESIASEKKKLRPYFPTNINIKYRDSPDISPNVKQMTADKLKIDLTPQFTELVLTNSVRFKLGSDVYLDRDGIIYRNINNSTNTGITAGSVNYGTGMVEIDSWTPLTESTVSLQSLTTTTDAIEINHISFRIPVIPVRPSSVTVVLSTVEFGTLNLQFDEQGKVETSKAHGSVNYETGFVDIFFYTKTEITAANRPGIEAKDWYDVLLEYEELNKKYINVPVWVVPDSVKYNAVAYTYIPLDASILGLSATRLPPNGRVPIFRVGDIGIVSAAKSMVMPDHIAGKTYILDDKRISWCELQDSKGVKVPFDMYVVNHDYGEVTLSGDFALNSLTPPLNIKYRYQDMGLIRDVQISGQVTFTKPLTHNYSAENTIVGSALVIGDMQARYSNMFSQGTWGNVWVEEPTGVPISARYNDALYPIATTNKGAIQERWALVFTDNTNFLIIGQYSGQIGTANINTDCEPINPVTGVPYFKIKKEGWGSGWVNNNVVFFDTHAAMFPVWVIRTVKQSEPTELTDQFQIMLRGDIDRVI
ncbi:hypothetical protein [Acinetobacter sp. NyZ410]|uniref:hypothetical protein n=1 Tax=Acinetobacter sp. NyZ410 TaxID=2929509 RepID=UPI001FBA09B4|nr:hypothetical protein [Acinetobacter sp. NyZ410]UOH19904.1 hypothetical protein MTO68_07080 [Acinetobacter sp. NyZ410]